jgi:hypothetical protein
MSARTWTGVFTTDEPGRDQRGLGLLLDAPPLLWPTPLLADEE